MDETFEHNEPVELELRPLRLSPSLASGVAGRAGASPKVAPDFLLSEL